MKDANPFLLPLLPPLFRHYTERQQAAAGGAQQPCSTALSCAANSKAASDSAQQKQPLPPLTIGLVFLRPIHHPVSLVRLGRKTSQHGPFSIGKSCFVLQIDLGWK